MSRRGISRPVLVIGAIDALLVVVVAVTLLRLPKKKEKKRKEKEGRHKVGGARIGRRAGRPLLFVVLRVPLPAVSVGGAGCVPAMWMRPSGRREKGREGMRGGEERRGLKGREEKGRGEEGREGTTVEGRGHRAGKKKRRGVGQERR